MGTENNASETDALSSLLSVEFIDLGISNLVIKFYGRVKISFFPSVHNVVGHLSVFLRVFISSKENCDHLYENS